MIVFRKFIDCYVFCRGNFQCAGELGIELKNCWYENYCGTIQTENLQRMVNTLNHDCIEAIAKKLDAVCFSDLVRIKPQLISIAQRKFENLVIDKSLNGSKFGVMNLCYVLASIGEIIRNITISMNVFQNGMTKKWNSKLKYGILRCIYENVPNLQSLTITGFGNDFSRFEPLIVSLQNKSVALQISWDIQIYKWQTKWQIIMHKHINKGFLVQFSVLHTQFNIFPVNKSLLEEEKLSKWKWIDTLQYYSVAISYIFV